MTVVTIPERKRHLAGALISKSALRFSCHAWSAVGEDGSVAIDLHAVDTWPFSGGEKVLRDLLLYLALGHDGPRVADLYRLDEENRDLAVAVIAESFGVEVAIRDFLGI